MDDISPPHSDSLLPSSDASVGGNPNSAQSSTPLTQPPPLLRPAPPSAPPSLLRQPPPLQTRPLQNRTPHNHPPPPPPLIRPAVASSLHQGALRNSLSSSSASAGQLPPSLVGLKVESPQSHWSPWNICLFIMVFRRPNLVSNQWKKGNVVMPLKRNMKRKKNPEVNWKQSWTCTKTHLAIQEGWITQCDLLLHFRTEKNPPYKCI